MRLKAKTVADLQSLLNTGLVTPTEWRAVVDVWPPSDLPRHLQTLTLEQYGRLTACKSDFEVVELCAAYGLCPHPTARRAARAFVADLAAIVKQIAAIDRAFAAIPSAGLTADEYAAGFASLKFGLFGLVDRLARRQGITDAQARQITVAEAVGKLTIDGKINQCERNLQRITATRAKQRARRSY